MNEIKSTKVSNQQLNRLPFMESKDLPIHHIPTSIEFSQLSNIQIDSNSTILKPNKTGEAVVNGHKSKKFSPDVFFTFHMNAFGS